MIYDRIRAGGPLCRAMTCQTLGVVSLSPVLHLPVRVVTSRASNATVGRIVALAIGQPVGLEADIVNVVRTIHIDLRPGPVALSAKVGQLVVRQFAQLRHGGPFDVSSLHGFHVRRGLTMAPLALHSRQKPFELQAALLDRVGRMAGKAIPRFRQGHDPARRFL
jgi:hypothetical protein